MSLRDPFPVSDDDDVAELGWTPEAIDVRDPTTKKLRLLNSRCTTCILGGDDSITPALRPGRLRELIKNIGDSYLACHSTLSNERPAAAICHGWDKAFGHTSQTMRIMERLNGFLLVDPPEKS